MKYNLLKNFAHHSEFRAQIKNLSYFFVLFSVFFSPLSLHFLNADLTSWATDFESEFSSLCNNERQRYVTRSMTDSDTWLDRWPTAIRDSVYDRQRYVTRSCSNFLTAADKEAAARDGRAATRVSLPGEMPQVSAFVATKLCFLRQNFCRDKTMFVATKPCLSRQNHVCRDKHTFVTSRQTRDKNDSCGSYRQWYTGPLLLLLLFYVSCIIDC